MPEHPVRNALTSIGVFTARPTAFIIVGVYAAGWFVFDRSSMDMHAVATLATWLMTLFIQRATHRDTQAIQAKLDELLRSHGDARNELMALDRQEPEDIEAHRDVEQAAVGYRSKMPISRGRTNTEAAALGRTSGTR
jgi:low affinity Fe/Cu permease